MCVCPTPYNTHMTYILCTWIIPFIESLVKIASFSNGIHYRGPAFTSHGPPIFFPLTWTPCRSYFTTLRIDVLNELNYFTGINRKVSFSIHRLLSPNDCFLMTITTVSL